MAQLSLQINGYGYVLGCADGEEAHLRSLAADLDRRIDEIKAATGPSGEARLLLMAALMLSDELHDLRGQPTPAAGSTEKVEPKIGRRLRGIAKRAEAIAESAEALPLTPTPDVETTPQDVEKPPPEAETNQRN
jgi:cell division protein ZapA